MLCKGRYRWLKCYDAEVKQDSRCDILGSKVPTRLEIRGTSVALLLVNLVFLIKQCCSKFWNKNPLYPREARDLEQFFRVAFQNFEGADSITFWNRGSNLVEILLGLK